MKKWTEIKLYYGQDRHDRVNNQLALLFNRALSKRALLHLHDALHQPRHDLLMFIFQLREYPCNITHDITRHNSVDSVPTSNLVCIKEVAVRTTLRIAGLIYYTCNFVTDIQCTCYKYACNKRFLTKCVSK